MDNRFSRSCWWVMSLLSSLHVDVYEEILCFAILRGLYWPLGSILTAYSRGMRVGTARPQAQAVKKAEAEGEVVVVRVGESRGKQV